ncbi:hypothetical protein BB559_005273 [Furculomyces boomerangus]|uniref:Uncharacterized protein n=1 Tax=Furculomyces boomerangus TaxID=61424 RepID=A0A2T9XXX6_9FUNG|nr:hypothetical protein BB559_007306 [Furculomyces boomerangus]PVU89009.1 hypothetical protein BB559_005273 [Furculomyces boomerangus]
MSRSSWLQASQLYVVNSLFLVATIPIFDYFIFPYISKRGIYLGPIKRITIGFWVVVVVTFAYVSMSNELHSTISQSGDKFLHTIFVSITGLEYAFSQAPNELKSILSALLLFTNCGGSLIGLILFIWSGDPTVLYTFIAQTVLLAVISVIFWFLFKHTDAEVRTQTVYG